MAGEFYKNQFYVCSGCCAIYWADHIPDCSCSAPSVQIWRLSARESENELRAKIEHHEKRWQELRRRINEIAQYEPGRLITPLTHAAKVMETMQAILDELEEK